MKKSTHIHCFDRKTSPVTLEDVFAVNNDSDISKDMEEPEVHKIKHNLTESTLPNKQIEFKTGSSRVSSYVIATYSNVGIVRGLGFEFLFYYYQRMLKVYLINEEKQLYERNKNTLLYFKQNWMELAPKQ